jgi:hypothetical protein
MPPPVVAPPLLAEPPWALLGALPLAISAEHALRQAMANGPIKLNQNAGRRHESRMLLECVQLGKTMQPFAWAKPVS